MQRIIWKLQDLIDLALDRLSPGLRWKIIDFLMQHELIDVCRVNGYFWSQNIGDDSLFDLGSCSWCRENPESYCGRSRR